MVRRRGGSFAHSSNRFSPPSRRRIKEPYEAGLWRWGAVTVNWLTQMSDFALFALITSPGTPSRFMMLDCGGGTYMSYTPNRSVMGCCRRLHMYALLLAADYCCNGRSTCLNEHPTLLVSQLHQPSN
jgi:hypothetical protein